MLANTYRSEQVPTFQVLRTAPFSKQVILPLESASITKLIVRPLRQAF